MSFQLSSMLDIWFIMSLCSGVILLSPLFVFSCFLQPPQFSASICCKYAWKIQAGWVGLGIWSLVVSVVVLLCCLYGAHLSYLHLGSVLIAPLKYPLNSSFFLNWCNVNPDKITKRDQLWFRRFVSIILNPFSRVFAISAFLKVIHAPKTSHFRYPENNLPTYIFSNPCNWDFP